MHVNRALQEGSRIGLAPGGIAEMFEGYPKPGMHPDVEYNVVGRGIFKMAIKHKAPIIPIYCFGATKLLRRLQLPAVVEKISLMVRVSLVLFFGQWGLPIPFRQRLRYVMGKPIYPPILQHSETESGILLDPEGVLNEQTEEMVSKYCEEMVRIFDRHKEAYGWAQKTLKMLKR